MVGVGGWWWAWGSSCCWLVTTTRWQPAGRDRREAAREFARNHANRANHDREIADSGQYTQSGLNQFALSSCSGCGQVTSYDHTPLEETVRTNRARSFLCSPRRCVMLTPPFTPPA